MDNCPKCNANWIGGEIPPSVTMYETTTGLKNEKK